MEQLLRGVIISEEEVRVICEKVKEILAKEENVVPVAAPVTVVRPRPTPAVHPFFLRAVRAGASRDFFTPSRRTVSERRPFGSFARPFVG